MDEKTKASLDGLVLMWQKKLIQTSYYARGKKYPEFFEGEIAAYNGVIQDINNTFGTNYLSYSSSDGPSMEEKKLREYLATPTKPCERS